MSWKKNIKTIALDADDTLWVNETHYQQTQEKFKNMLSHYINIEDLEDKLYTTEKKNLQLFGYGIKGFVISMIETAIELTNSQVNAKDIQVLIDLGKEMLVKPIKLIEGVREAVQELSLHYDLMILTKGDLFTQENKIARSGLSDFFTKFEIVSEKREQTYLDILLKHQIRLEEFLMVGNSLKSDVLPVCKIGGRAVHIPFSTIWIHETPDIEQKNSATYSKLANLGELLPFLQEA